MTIVFIGPPGVPPNVPAASIGQTATNQMTGEKWFVNLNNQWQQQIGK